MCGRCEQAMEKALKALLLSERDTSRRRPLLVTTHDICELASLTDNPWLVTAARQLQAIVGVTPRMCYPDFLPNAKIPRDVYTLDMALNAFSLVDESLQVIRQSLHLPLQSGSDW